MVLCINKVDRLFEEIKLTPLEIFFRLQQLIADANEAIEQLSGRQHYFDIRKNVEIASAYQGWGFSL